MSTIEDFTSRLVDVAFGVTADDKHAGSSRNACDRDLTARDRKRRSGRPAPEPADCQQQNRRRE